MKKEQQNKKQKEETRNVWIEWKYLGEQYWIDIYNVKIIF